MLTRIDEKGKKFTEIINKEPVNVLIKTTSCSIQGDIYLRPEERIKDSLNQGDQFIAVTDVVVTFTDSSCTDIQTPFLVVNKEEIVWLSPIEEDR